MDDRARAALARLVAQEGPLVGDDPRRVEGLLRDLVPQCRAEISVLTTAARARVPHALGQSGGSSPLELRLTRLARELEQDAALAPAAARWAVDSWALALGLPVPSAASTASQSQPSAPPVAPATDDSVWAPSAGTAPGASAYPSYPSGGATGPTSARGPAQGAPPPQGYAPPAHGTPAYGQPAYGPPGYGQPGGAPPAGTPGYQPPPGYGSAPYPNGERPAGAGYEYGAPPGSFPPGAPVPGVAPGPTAPGGVVAAAPAKKSRWKGWSAGLVTAAVLIRSCGAILRLAGDSTDEATAATADSTHVAAAADSARGSSAGATSGAPAVAAPSATPSVAPSVAPSAAEPSSTPASAPSYAASAPSTVSPGAASPGAASPGASAASAPTAGAGGPQRGKWLVKWGRTGEQYTALLTMSGERGDLRVLVKDSGGNVLGIQQPVHLVLDDASGATGWVRGDTAYVVKGNPPAGFSYSPDQLRYETSAGAVRFTQVCDAQHACQPLLLSFAGGGQ